MLGGSGGHDESGILHAHVAPRENSDTLVPDIPRLIYKLERNHAAETGKLQADVRSCWREIAELRLTVSKVRPAGLQSETLPQPTSVTTQTELGGEHANSRQDRQLPSARDHAGPSLAVSAAVARDVEQLRSEFSALQTRLDEVDQSFRNGLHRELLSEVRRGAAELQNLRALVESTAEDRKSQLRTFEAAAADVGAAACEALERRVRALEINHCLLLQQDEAGADDGSAREGLDLHVRVQMAALSRQVDHLQEEATAAHECKEDDQGTLRALLRTSRIFAEQLGVGPVLLGRTHSHCGLAAEAEALAASVAQAWRKQKASGTFPAGTANVIEALPQKVDARSIHVLPAACKPPPGSGGRVRSPAPRSPAVSKSHDQAYMRASGTSGADDFAFT